eukprot:jgi/Tetstr1/443018/TSEL_031078.t1
MKVIVPGDEQPTACPAGGHRAGAGLDARSRTGSNANFAEDEELEHRPPTPFARGAVALERAACAAATGACLPSLVGVGRPASAEMPAPAVPLPDVPALRCACLKPRADGLCKAERAARPGPARPALRSPECGAQSTRTSAKKSVKFAEQLEHVMPDWRLPAAEECGACCPPPREEESKRPLEEDFSWLAVFSAGGAWMAESTLKLAAPVAQGAWDWLSQGGVSGASTATKRRKQVSWSVWSGGLL